MEAYFTDSSAVVKRYVQENGSAWVSGLFAATPTNEISIVAISTVEVVSAISRRVRGGMTSEADAASACALFLADLAADHQIFDVTDVLLRQAIHLARVYRLRGCDAVQLAAANEVNRLRIAAGLSPVIFVSADNELNTAARSEGLAVGDSNAHP